ncbi:MAG: hypothetical protein IH587_04125 [Anaerolineae bacterium]|nr:hypothetical protein [Anaerolineae bacterium]
MIKIRTVLILILTSLAVAGCNLSSDETPPTSPPGVDNPTATGGNESTETYTDMLSGIAFDYPSGWTVSPPPPAEAVAYAITLASYDFLDPNAPGVGGVPPGTTKVDVAFAPLGSTVGDVRDQLETDISAGFITLLEEQERTFGDATPGMFIRGQDTFNTEFTQIIREIGERVVQITQYGDGNALELIATSMRVVSQ